MQGSGDTYSDVTLKLRCCINTAHLPLSCADCALGRTISCSAKILDFTQSNMELQDRVPLGGNYVKELRLEYKTLLSPVIRYKMQFHSCPQFKFSLSTRHHPPILLPKYFYSSLHLPPTTHLKYILQLSPTSHNI